MSTDAVDRGAPGAPPITDRLSSWTWPLPVDEFMTHFWQRRCFYEAGDPQRIGALVEALGGLEPAGLLQRSSSYTVIGRKLDGKGLASAGQPPVAQALDLHDCGMTLYLDFEHDDAEVVRWRHELATQLGKARDDGLCSVYLARTGAGLVPHYDKNDNFTVQLSGRKRWYVSDTFGFDAPLDNSTEEVAGRAWYRSAPRSLEPPSTWRVIDLEPGACLYVPRGAWHATDSLGDSISFNLNLNPTPWLDFVLDPLMRRLGRSVAWRRSAQRGPAGREQLRALLENLRRELEEIDVDDFHEVAATVPAAEPELRLRRNPLAHWYVEPAAAVGRSRLSLMTAQGTAAGYELPDWMIDATRWGGAQRDPFTGEEVARHCGRPVSQVRPLVELWLEAGLVRPAHRLEELADAS